MKPLYALVSRWKDWNDTSMTPLTCAAELEAALREWDAALGRDGAIHTATVREQLIGLPAKTP